MLPALERRHDVLALDAARARGRAAARRARSHDGGSPTRSSARWTRRASRPRTSSATRSAATSRCSWPRAGGRGRSWRSRPAGGWAHGDESYKDVLALPGRHARAGEGGGAARRRDRRHARGPAPRDRSSSSRATSTSRPSCSPTRCVGVARCDGGAPTDRATRCARAGASTPSGSPARCGSSGAPRPAAAVAVGRRALPRRLAPARRLGRARRRRPLPAARRAARDRAADPRLHGAVSGRHTLR